MVWEINVLQDLSHWNVFCCAIIDVWCGENGWWQQYQCGLAVIELPATIRITHKQEWFVIMVVNGFHPPGHPPSSPVVEGELERAEPWAHTSWDTSYLHHLCLHVKYENISLTSSKWCFPFILCRKRCGKLCREGCGRHGRRGQCQRGWVELPTWGWICWSEEKQRIV